MTARWIIHTKDGKSYTDATHLPSDVPDDQITSVERVVNGKSIVIKKNPDLYFFFVKATESKDLVITFEGAQGPVDRPKVVEALAIGCHLGQPPNVYRLELECDPRTGNVLLQIQKVKEATKDGFP
jgi:hypothetical protein